MSTTMVARADAATRSRRTLLQGLALDVAVAAAVALLAWLPAADVTTGAAWLVLGVAVLKSVLEPHPALAGHAPAGAGCFRRSRRGDRRQPVASGPMRTTLLGLAAALALTLTACSSDDSDETADGDNSAGSSAADLQSGTPDCADVWVDGGTLPDDYEGCREADGATSAAVYYDCDDGRKLASYEDGAEELWAFYGESISTGSDDYEAAFDTCRP